MSKILDQQIQSLSTLTTEQLREELDKSLKITAEQLIRMAAVVRLLEDRGESLDDIRLSLLGYLRKIAFGQILPEVVVQFQNFPLLLSRVSALPIPDQQLVLVGKPMPVVILEGGKTDKRLCDPLKMSGAEVRQIFARDHIRDEGEQVSWLRNRPGRVAPAVNGGIQVDSHRKGIVVTGEKVFISRHELVNFLARVTD